MIHEIPIELSEAVQIATKAMKEHTDKLVKVEAERDALARQLAISRALLMECAQNLSPPWQNPDHPLWSLKSRIKATFGGQSS